MKKVMLFLMMLMVSLFALPVMGADAAVEAASIDWLAIILGSLFAISEVLSTIPALEGNSIFQLVMTILKALVTKSVVALTLLLCFVVLPAFSAEVAVVEAPSVFAIVFGSLLAVSEVLASIPKLSANSIFQLVLVVLRAITGK